MFKKPLFALGAVLALLVGVAGMSAFEAHIINVTAQIENALTVSESAIDFGTVFPQEHLNKPLTVQLSSSFLTEEDVDDVNYIIRQKPKCGWTTDNGTVLVGPTATGHVIVEAEGETRIDCGQPEKPVEVPAEATWGLLPSLCEYISKEPDMDEEEQNDDTMPSFHQPYKTVYNTTTSEWELVWNDTKGRLAKSDLLKDETELGDTVDNWTIDLAVPCFGDFCAQDWESFVHSINPEAVASEYVKDIADEHKIFGCDLWVEVTGISRYPN